LPEWDQIRWNPELGQAQPEPHFYLFSMPAKLLKELSGIYRRNADINNPNDRGEGPQRIHDEQRSADIREYVRYGFPWSDLNDAKRESGDFDDLLKPGWLPTAIVVNILNPGEQRNGVELQPEHAIVLNEQSGGIRLRVPEEMASGDQVFPIEVIDGQHRLWAFENVDSSLSDYELPVVAFHGLDKSWQAYLFWTINIKPKRINASLAFDLYPMLRGEDWLDRFHGHSIYRDTRAQELVEHLWSHPRSPWRNRINMLGESGHRGKRVSQAAWIRSLTSTFVKSWPESGKQIGGLFGAKVGSHDLVLPWSRSQQAALLISMWTELERAVATTTAEWAGSMRNSEFDDGSLRDMDDVSSRDPAFVGQYSLLSSDQGVRAVLYAFNDLLFLGADNFGLFSWNQSISSDGDDGIESAIEGIQSHNELATALREISLSMAGFDWRSSSFPDFPPDSNLRDIHAGYRGSGGYRLLREHLYRWVADQPYPEIANLARMALKTMGVQ
jgi:DGQHR domain-containing protein